MPDRPRLEAVLFDAGGTLGRLDFEGMAEAVTELGHPLDAATLRAAEIEGRRRYDESVGMRHRDPEPGEPSPPLGVVGETRAYFGGMLEAAGVPRATIPAVLERWQARQAGSGLWSRLMEGAPECLAGVRALGLRRAVVSNSDGRAAQHIRAWGLDAEIEFVVDSQVVGVEKPDPRIFEIALRRLALPAEQVLYVGDIRSVDEAGSRAAGLHFVLIDPTGRYAGPGTPHVARIAEVPAWIERRFTTPAAAAGGTDASELHSRSTGAGGSS
jgi:HAD superfamily hydrolase (TIGR01509 family)